MLLSQLRHFFLALLGGALLAGCGPKWEDARGRELAEESGLSPIELQFVALELEDAPQMIVDFKFIPGSDELFVLDFLGAVHHYRLIDQDHAQLLGKMAISGVHLESDCGLLSLALDPDFQQNRFFYLGYCLSTHESGIFRYQFDPANYEGVDASASKILSAGDERSDRPWHNIGSIGFTEEGELWALFGDKTKSDNAKDKGNLLGAAIRVIPNRDAQGSGYLPSPKNPYLGRDGHDAIWATGLRSPWRGSLRSNGDLLIGDVGSDHIEEVNLLRSDAGVDFGWPEYEGPCPSGKCTSVDPIAYYGHSLADPYVNDDLEATSPGSRSIWVGPFYEGERDRYEGYLSGKMLFGDFCVGFVRSLGLDADGSVDSDQHIAHLPHVSAVQEAENGWLYASTFGGCGSVDPPAATRLGRLSYRLRPEAEMAPIYAKAKLSDYPLFTEAGNLESVEAGVLSYEPEFPLWSNGLRKRRHLLLPPDEKLRLNQDGEFDFPDDTLLFKTFSEQSSEGERPVETRLMLKREGIWHFYAYLWQDGDAFLLDAHESPTVTVEGLGVGEVGHIVPSQRMCGQCHLSATSPVLGLTPLQLQKTNSMDANGQGGAGQLPADSILAEWVTQGIVEEQNHEFPPAISADDDLTREVLGFFTGNCIHCHNGGTGESASFDLRHESALENLILQPTESSASAAGIRVVPGEPAQSIVYQAVSWETENDELKRMPAIGVQVPSPEAVTLLREWILALPVAQ